jgi:hypothetical protein
VDDGTYGKVVKSFELGRLHDGVQHGLHDEADVVHNLILSDVKTHERLEEANKDNKQQKEEDERLAEHDFQHHQHGAEEAESIKVEQQTHPEHGRCEGEEVVAQLVEIAARIAVFVRLVRWVADGDHAEDE